MNICALASVPPLVHHACYVAIVPEVRRGAVGACSLGFQTRMFRAGEADLRCVQAPCRRRRLWRGWHISAFSPRQMHGPAQGFTAFHHVCARELRLPCKGVQYLFCSLVYTCALASVPPLVRRACFVSFVPEVRRGALGACALLEPFLLDCYRSAAVPIPGTRLCLGFPLL